MAAESLIDRVSTAFPNTDKQTIASDVLKLINDLLARNLIRTGRDEVTVHSLVSRDSSEFEPSTSRRLGGMRCRRFLRGLRPISELHDTLDSSGHLRS